MANPYLKVDIRTRDWDQRVSKFTIVVHTEGRWENSGLSNNHVTQYLLLPGNRSVQINMRHVDDEDINGRFEMVSRDYTAENSQSLIRKFDLPIHEVRPTVRSINDRIVGGQRAQSSKGLKDFCFTNAGMGCRYWHITLLSLYESYLWVPPRSTLGLFVHLSWLYTRTPNVAPRTTRVLPGTYDDPGVQRMAKQLWERLHSLAAMQTQTLSAQAHQLNWIVQNHAFVVGNWTQVRQDIQTVIIGLQQRGVDIKSRGSIQDLYTQALASATAAGGTKEAIEDVQRRATVLAEQRAEEDEEDED